MEGIHPAPDRQGKGPRNIWVQVPEMSPLDLIVDFTLVLVRLYAYLITQVGTWVPNSGKIVVWKL